MLGNKAASGFPIILRDYVLTCIMVIFSSLNAIQVNVFQLANKVLGHPFHKATDITKHSRTQLFFYFLSDINQPTFSPSYGQRYRY